MYRPRPWVLVLAAGLTVVALGALISVAPWYAALRWQTSSEAARAARNADAPTLVPVTPRAVVVAEPTSRSAIRTTSGSVVQPTSAPAVQAIHATPAPTESAFSQPAALQAQIDDAPTATPMIPELQLASAAFVFDDPPQPGAHAHLSVSLTNQTDLASPPVSLSLPLGWLAGYHLDSTSPDVQSGTQTDRSLQLSFDGPPAESDEQLTLSFTTTDEVIDAPNLSVLDAVGRTIGQAHPATQAPPPRPGPIYSIDIPRLKLHTGVVPVEWEPPLFVVGQVRTSAFVTQGNSVLVGHVRGAAGYNVFDHLDQLEPGDAIIADSRGQNYSFVVTQMQVLPEDDTSPTDSTRLPRLTLMTCAGDWNPITQDYADRLWVVAEPTNPTTPVRGVD